MSDTHKWWQTIIQDSKDVFFAAAALKSMDPGPTLLIVLNTLVRYMINLRVNLKNMCLNLRSLKKSLI